MELILSGSSSQHPADSLDVQDFRIVSLSSLGPPFHARPGPDGMSSKHNPLSSNESVLQPGEQGAIFHSILGKNQHAMDITTSRMTVAHSDTPFKLKSALGVLIPTPLLGRGGFFRVELGKVWI